MQPFPALKSVIVMDNCAIHKAPEIRELIESRYVNLCLPFKWITNIGLGECVSSTYPRIHPTSTRLSWHSPCWSPGCAADRRPKALTSQCSNTCTCKPSQSVHQTAGPFTINPGTSNGTLSTRTGYLESPPPPQLMFSPRKILSFFVHTFSSRLTSIWLVISSALEYIVFMVWNIKKSMLSLTMGWRMPDQVTKSVLCWFLRTKQQWNHAEIVHTYRIATHTNSSARTRIFLWVVIDEKRRTIRKCRANTSPQRFTESQHTNRLQNSSAFDTLSCIVSSTNFLRLNRNFSLCWTCANIFTSPLSSDGHPKEMHCENQTELNFQWFSFKLSCIDEDFPALFFSTFPGTYHTVLGEENLKYFIFWPKVNDAARKSRDLRLCQLFCK